MDILDIFKIIGGIVLFFVIIACGIVLQDKIYPPLVGTEYENFLFTRWELQFGNISHSDK